MRGSILELINKCARCACANNPPLSVFYSDLREGLEVDKASGGGMSLLGSSDAAGERGFYITQCKESSGLPFQLSFLSCSLSVHPILPLRMD